MLVVNSCVNKQIMNFTLVKTMNLFSKNIINFGLASLPGQSPCWPRSKYAYDNNTYKSTKVWIGLPFPQSFELHLTIVRLNIKLV